MTRPSSASDSVPSRSPSPARKCSTSGRGWSEPVVPPTHPEGSRTSEDMFWCSSGPRQSPSSPPWSPPFLGRPWPAPDDRDRRSPCRVRHIFRTRPELRQAYRQVCISLHSWNTCWEDLLCSSAWTRRPCCRRVTCPTASWRLVCVYGEIRKVFDLDISLRLSVWLKTRR